MELVTRLEERFEQLVNKINELKSENQRLKDALETEKANREEARTRIEALIERIQGEIE
jgi:cell division protein ZapB